MKHRRNVASNVPPKALLCLGENQYFFTSESLGPCIAITFPDEHPTPAEKKDKGHERFQREN
jgi:hypothetical protein